MDRSRIVRPWRVLLAALAVMTLVLTGCGSFFVTSGGEVLVRVLDKYGRPLPGVYLTLDGETVTSDALGEASFEGVSPGYDLALHYAPFNEIRVYRGLSLKLPVIRWAGASAGAWESEATVDGFVTNLSATVNPTTVWTGLLTEGFDTYGTMGTETGSGIPYSATPHWSSAGSTTLYGYAVEAEYDGGGTVIGLRGAYETRSLDPGVSATLDLPLVDYTLGQISGNVTVPSGQSHVYHEYGVRVGLDTAGFVDFPLENSGSTGGTFNHVTFDLPPPWVSEFYTYDFFQGTSGDGWTVSRGSLDPNQTGVSVSGTLAVPSLGFSDGATLSAGDPIDLGSNSSTYALAFEATSPSATSPHVLIIGTGDEVVLPDLSEFGTFSGSYSANLRLYSLDLGSLLSEEMDGNALFSGYSTVLDFEMPFTRTYTGVSVSF